MSFTLSPDFAKAIMAISEEEFEEGDLEKTWPKLNSSELSKISKILVTLDRTDIAFNIVTDRNLKFDYAVKLARLDDACEIAEELNEDDKWQKIGDLCMQEGDFDRAEYCFKKSSDYTSLFLIYSSLGTPIMCLQY